MQAPLSPGPSPAIRQPRTLSAGDTYIDSLCRDFRKCEPVGILNFYGDNKLTYINANNLTHCLYL
jgi:hypothetical protein